MLNINTLHLVFPFVHDMQYIYLLCFLFVSVDAKMSVNQSIVRSVRFDGGMNQDSAKHKVSFLRSQGHCVSDEARTRSTLSLNHCTPHFFVRRDSPILQMRKFSRGFCFRETSHMRSLVKIKSSRIGEITLPLTDMGKSRPCRDFLTSKICGLTLFVNIKLSRKFPTLKYLLKKMNSANMHIKKRNRLEFPFDELFFIHE